MLAVLLLGALALAGAAWAPSPAAAQVTAVDLVERGRPVPLDVSGEMIGVGRAAAHALLAGAHRDVTRPVTDAHIAALGRRGTLLRVRLAEPERVVLLRLGARARPSRLAAYVPPGRDDQAFVFLGRASWDRIVVVSLPDGIRSAVRRLRSEAARSESARSEAARSESARSESARSEAARSEVAADRRGR